MLHEVYYLIWIFILSPGILASYVEQAPYIISIAEGESKTLWCSLKDTSYLQMYWYRQQPNRTIEALFYSAATGASTNYTSGYYQAKRPSQTLFSLDLRSATSSHTAVYFCACSDTGLSEAYFGTGTKLVVMEHPVKFPKVTILKPSPAELREKRKATVVCLVTDFYPDNIQIHWYVNGEKQPENDAKIQSDPESIIQEDSKSYSASSRIRFNEEQWLELTKVECRVNHYTNGSEPTSYTSQFYVNAETCGMSKEAKAQSMTPARMTYLMVLCKSILYALFVSMIVWKSKISHSKRFD
nr:T-cell receptor beta chain [Ginglymostoma cirratum]